MKERGAMVSADKLIHLLPAAGIPSGQRIEDHLSNVGQQQWWESRESARLWKGEPPSVAGTLSPRRHRRRPAQELATQPAQSNPDHPPGHRQRKQHRSRESVLPEQTAAIAARDAAARAADALAAIPPEEREPAGIITGALLDEQPEEDGIKRTFRRRAGITNPKSTVHGQQKSEYQRRFEGAPPTSFRKHRAHYHDLPASAPSQKLVTRTTPMTADTEYRRTYTYKEPKRRTVAVGTESAPIRDPTKAGLDGHGVDDTTDVQILPSSNTDRALESVYDHDYAWPVCMPRDTTARPMADHATAISDELPEVQPRPLPPPQVSEYRRSYAWPEPIIPTSTQDSTSGDDRVMHTPRNKHVFVGNPGETIKQVREYRRDNDVSSDGEGSDDGGADLQEENLDAFEQGYEEDTEDEAEEPQEGTQQQREVTRNVYRGMPRGGVDFADRSRSIQPQQVPRVSVPSKQPREPPAAYDHDDDASDAEEDEADGDSDAPAPRAYPALAPPSNRPERANAEHTSPSNDAVWQDAPLRQYPLGNDDLYEQGMTSSRSDMQDVYASEYSERFQNPANWSPLRPTTLMGDTDQADDVHEESNAHQVPTHLRPRVAVDVKLSSYEELRAKAEEYKARSHRCTITEFLGGLRDQQQALLARAKRFDAIRTAAGERRRGERDGPVRRVVPTSTTTKRNRNHVNVRNSVAMAEATLNRAAQRRNARRI
eukprot:m.318195 g.318195  ORF g.318195 m.318195 type:complete len:712 (-) comp20285_c0_seq1:56-2191(-)